MQDECGICKKFVVQGGRCPGGTRNCLCFEEEPRGRIIQETIAIDYGWNPSVLIKGGEKLELKDGWEITVCRLEYVDFLAWEVCVVATYHESEKPPECKRQGFKILQGGKVE